MKKILVIGKYKNTEVGIFLQKIVNFLLGQKYDLYLDEESINVLGETYQKADKDEMYDLGIVIGGDGTMMGAARTWGLKGIPLLGVNYGRIGFLTDLDKDSVFEKLNEVLNGKFHTEERDLLQITVTNGKTVLYEESAVNDVVVGNSVTGKLMEISLFINDEFINSQYADGMIIATATGSTAYSLAAGGSIIHPGASVFNIVPICPQNLSNRPLVVSSEYVIKIFCSGRNKIYWAVDGIETEHVPVGYYFVVSKNEKKVKLVHPEDYSYFQGLRKKLGWG